MTTIDRTAYPRFRATLTPMELHDHCTPTVTELALVETNTRDDAAKLTFLVLYKCFQCLGYLPRDQEIPPEVIAHLRWYLHLDENVACQVPPRSRRRYGTLIRQALKVTLDIQKALEVARHSMEQAAQVMDHPPDLINAALETLIKDCYELPAFSTLDRLAGEVRTQVNDRWCAQILARIPDGDRRRLDQLLATPDGKSDYNRLKETPKSATLSHLQAWFERLRWLQSFGDVGAFVAEVPVLKIQHLAAEARSLDVAELRDYGAARRSALVVSLLYYTQIQTQDQLVTMLIKRMAAIHQQAREKLEALLLQERTTMESWMQGMAEITRTVAEGVDDTTLGKFARSMVDRFGGPDAFLAAYEALAKYHGNNYLPLMGSYFASHRAALFRVLRSLDLRSTSQDQTLISAVEYLLVHERRRKKYLPPAISLDFGSRAMAAVRANQAQGEDDVRSTATGDVCVQLCRQRIQEWRSRPSWLSRIPPLQSDSGSGCGGDQEIVPTLGVGDFEKRLVLRRMDPAFWPALRVGRQSGRYRHTLYPSRLLLRMQPGSSADSAPSSPSGLSA